MLARGAKAEEMRKMHITMDEKDWQIKLLKEMIRGVKGELKVRDVDIKRLKNKSGLTDTYRNNWINAITDGSASESPTKWNRSLNQFNSHHEALHRSWINDSRSIDQPSNTTFDSTKPQLELPPIQYKEKPKYTKTPNLYRIKRKKHDLTSWDSLERNRMSPETDYPNYNTQGKSSKLRHRDSVQPPSSRNGSPTFKTQLAEDSIQN